MHSWNCLKLIVFMTLIFVNYLIFLIAALIFSAGYYSAPIFFLLRRIKKCFALPHFAAFSGFCVKSFHDFSDFSRLVPLFSHSAKSDFEHQLLSKAIQNEQSQYKKLKSEIETG